VHHVVVTRNGTNQRVVVYLDGVQQFAFTDSSGLAVFSGPNNIIYFLRDDAVSQTENPSGLLSRVRLYTGVLTPAQVLALYQLG
jgi:hypothetical protein